MSDSIVIKGVTSYHPDSPQIIDISKQNTLLFGLNGTGKSTISNYLYDRDAFPSCALNIEGAYNLFVYNQSFIDENFVNSETQKGIFTLSKDNSELEMRISEKTQLRERLRAIYKDTQSKIDLAINAKKEANDSAIQEVYEKKHLIQSTSLEPFLVGFKTPKSKFYDQIKKHSETADISINELDIEYKELNQYDKTPPFKVELPKPPQISKEDIQLLKEPIIGSSSSQLAKLIEQLDNLGWVKLGVDSYLKDKLPTCPFCQKDTIDDSFRTEILALFDKNYDDNIEKIKKIYTTYQNDLIEYTNALTAAFTICSLYNPEQHHIQPLIDAIEREHQDNLSLISSKIQKPSICVEVISYSEMLHLLETIADGINKTVDAVSQKVQKFKENENDIRNRMWGSLKHHAHDIFSIEKRIVDQKDKEIDALSLLLKKIKRIGSRVGARISALRSKTSNIDDTIDRINENLKSLGISSFEIVKSTVSEQENYFALSRGKQSNAKIFESLSEGEKTLITFLYFIEMSNGSMSKNSDIADKEKIIVIDDPISSLSQNYIYDIASLIQSKIISGNRFKKVIILTHSLFFFHELLKLATKKTEEFENKYSLFRLTKNEYTQVSPMARGELKNDYQSLWQIMKDVVESKADPVVLPNVMRNILEYYFGFVQRKDQLAEILNRLADKEPNQGHKSFYRYINRESHSDPTNIGFMINVDPAIYIERFKMIFTASNDEEHFTCMMQ